MAAIRGPLLVSLPIAALALGSLIALLLTPVSYVLGHHNIQGYDPVRMVLLYSTLPRLCMALLCGAGLAVSGAILQQVLRNPLASPTTLGADAGARLALGIASILTPGFSLIGRNSVAFLGSTLAVMLVWILGRRREFSTVAIVLAGLIVSLYCGALSSILILFKDRYLTSLLIWGGGSLSQQSWAPFLALLLRFGLILFPLVLLLRPLSVMDLDDSSATSLGMSVTKLRVIAIGTAIALSSVVASLVGIIGFVGLVGPLIAQLAGARRFTQRLIWSAIFGALLLLLTDCALQLIAGGSSEFIPTGAVTAVLGSPLLIFLLPRLRIWTRPPIETPRSELGRLPQWLPRLGLVVLSVILLATTTLLGRSVLGAWNMATFADWPIIEVWRLPRVLATLSAGALLAGAGYILQQCTNNEMASPEVLGVSAGGTMAVAMCLLTGQAIQQTQQDIIATAGGLTVLFVILLIGRRSSFAPERVLLTGIALNALLDALVGVMSATGEPRSILLLSWMAGSTSGIALNDAIRTAVLAVILISLSLLTTRWLRILPLGDSQTRALGVHLSKARLALLLLAAIMTAIASPVIGPLTFVGLMAPHIVRMMGIRTTTSSLLSAAFVGAGLMAFADTVARTIAFPMQLPTGLTASLLGAPFLMFLLTRRRTA